MSLTPSGSVRMAVKVTDSPSVICVTFELRERMTGASSPVEVVPADGVLVAASVGSGSVLALVLVLVLSLIGGVAVVAGVEGGAPVLLAVCRPSLSPHAAA